jgi:hypothetical protein
MKKLVAVAAVLFAFHAYAGGGSILVCESMTVCRFPPPYQDYDTPALTFDTTAGGFIDVSVNLWLSQDCQGDPDASMQQLNEQVLSAGTWYFSVDNWAVYSDGTDYSIQWTIDGCPSTDCINGTTGSSPDICQF